MTAEGNPARVQVIHPETHPLPQQLNAWLEQLTAKKGSDLLLVPNAPASIRVEAVLVGIGSKPLTGEEIEAAVLPALAAHAREDFQREGIGDSSYRMEGLGRFRINLHRDPGRGASASGSSGSHVSGSRTPWP